MKQTRRLQRFAILGIVILAAVLLANVSIATFALWDRIEEMRIATVLVVLWAISIYAYASLWRFARGIGHRSSDGA